MLFRSPNSDLYFILFISDFVEIMRPLYIDFIKVAQDIIEANFDNDAFGCPELCNALQMSRSQVHRKIKTALNISTSDFIKQIRLEKAKELLTSTDQSISNIAYKVGYSDANYFSRSFSKIYGVPPSQFRQPTQI